MKRGCTTCILSQNNKACNGTIEIGQKCHFITLRNSVFRCRMQTTDDGYNAQNIYSPRHIVHDMFEALLL